MNWGVLLMALSICTMASLAGAQDSESATFALTVQVDRGKDIGQNFGSLFEVHSSDGLFVLGAGFSGAYGTYVRDDRHNVHFFVRPTAAARKCATERLPRPSGKAGTYLFGVDGVLHATSDGFPAVGDVQVWNGAEKRWDATTDLPADKMRLGDGRLAFARNEVLYNGEPILTAPEQGDYYRFYYAQGHFFFYHTYWADKSGYREHTDNAEGFSKLYACPWVPGDGGPVNLDRAVVLSLPVVGETPFAYGQFREDVLTASNIGGLYAFNGSDWRMLLPPQLGVSFQIYTMIEFYDRLLMGQYPTGELFEFDGEKVTRLEGWPPKMPGVSGSAREAQSMLVYGGDLFVGVWPWGEVWRYSQDAGQWDFPGRMFTHPELTDETTHPYEVETAALGPVANQWGQRVTSLVPLGDAMMVGTSAKWPCDWKPDMDFLGDDKWKEYGSVIRLTMPGALCAPLAWTDGPTDLEFVIKGRDMVISQDGKTLASCKLDEALAAMIADSPGLDDVVWGKGAFGLFGGKAVRGEVRAARAPLE
jgi:hypothetical protein